MLIDQYKLSGQLPFQNLVEAAIVHAAIAISNEVVNEVQSIVDTGASSGTFTLTFNGQTTTALNWNATAGQVQAALQLLSTVGNGNVVCTGGPLPGTAISITFTGTQGALPQNVLTHTDTLTGGSIVVSRTTAGVAVVNHAARQTLASKILANPVGYMQLMVLGVSDSAAVQADFPSPNYTLTATEAAAETDIQNQVNAIFNAYS